MSVCNYIVLISCLYLLFNHPKLSNRQHFTELFFFVGIITAYNDFLTYPVVTLGFLLIAYFCLYNVDLFENIKKLILFTFAWALGYGAMWVSKWLLADFTLHTGTIKNAMASFTGWTDVVGGRPRGNGLFYTLQWAVSQYGSIIYLILAIIAVLFNILALALSIYKKETRSYFKNLTTFLLIALLPVGWMLVTEHHSAVHIHFVFRILGISAAAFMAAAMTSLIDKKEPLDIS